MSPTFLPGDFIIGSQVSYGLKFPWSQDTWFKAAPKKGDLIVFTFKSRPAITYVKRVAAVAGDEVDTSQGKQTVGPSQVYVLSDNPNILEDSRDLGMVSIEQIESRAQFILFSFSPENEIRWNRILTQIEKR